jgi:hybrid cluster-associated redox disulfide protein
MSAEATAPPPITLEMSVAEVVSRFPETIAVFGRHGVACVGCSVAEEDTIGDAALAHGVDSVALLDDLNACLGFPAQ